MASIAYEVDGGELELTDEGIEMPEMLKGYVGEFKINVPKGGGGFFTKEQGLTTDEYSNALCFVYPEAGDYHDNLEEGEMVIQARGHPITKFKVVDNRSGQ